MPVLIPRRTIVVRRDGKNITPPIGQSFSFTDDEYRTLRDHPNHWRHPRNENPETVVPDAPGPRVDGQEAPPKPEAPAVINTAPRGAGKAAKTVPTVTPANAAADASDL